MELVYWSVSLSSSRGGDDIKRVEGGIVIIARCKLLFNWEHENLVIFYLEMLWLLHGTKLFQESLLKKIIVMGEPNKVQKSMLKMDIRFFLSIIELLCFLICIRLFIIHHTKIETNRITLFLTCLNHSYQFVQADVPTLIWEKLRF